MNEQGLENPVSGLSPESREFLLAEYNALRNEILKRTEIQHQLVTLALVAAGTFLSINVTSAILAYPILALFIAAAWKQSDNTIASLGVYIGTRLEPLFLADDQGWQHFYAGIRDPSLLGSLAHLASRGILGGTQVLVFFVGLLKTNFATVDIILLVLDFLVIVLTQIILRRSPPVNKQGVPIY